MAALRKACPEIGYGSWHTLSQGDGQVLVLHYTWRGRELTVIHNFSPEDREIDLSIEETGASTLHNLLDGQTIQPQRNHYTLRLKGHGYLWLRGVTSD